MGVHRKSSNVGVWGETGRYPLIYTSIRLTLNYYKRLLNISKTSFVSAALKEQKSLKLQWFKNVAPLLKLDKIYSLDHVSAHRVINLSKQYNSYDITLENIKKNCKPNLKELENLTKAQHLPTT